MPLKIQNVILLGGTSILGQRFVEYITTIDHPFTVTITTRNPDSPPAWFPRNDAQFKLVDVNFNSHESLVNALRGQDAAVGLLGAPLLEVHPAVVDAAIDAGVKLFIPSDFGYDASTDNPKLDELIALPVSFWKTKASSAVHIRNKAEAGKIKFISIINGAFFEWGLSNGFIGFNFGEKKVTRYDGGDSAINAATTNKIGEAIARVLLNPSPYINNTVAISSVTYTQNEILRIIEETTGDKWTVEETTSAGAIENGKKLAATQPLIAAYAIVAGVLYDTNEKYAPLITRKDADALGIAQDDVKSVVLSVLSA